MFLMTHAIADIIRNCSDLLNSAVPPCISKPKRNLELRLMTLRDQSHATTGGKAST